MDKGLFTTARDEAQELFTQGARRYAQAYRALERKYEKATAALRRIKEEEGGREALLAQAALEELGES